MQGMFVRAKAFNQPIFKNFAGSFSTGENTEHNWYTLNVRNMASMFQDSSSFNQNISNWTTYNVTDMSDMFASAVKFNNNENSLGTTNNWEWNTSNVTRMTGMFFGATVFNVSVNSWDVSNVTDMSYMFAEARAFNHISINTWTPKKLIYANHMFMRAVTFNKPLDYWNDNVGNLMYMVQMFYGTINFNQDLSGWKLTALINSGRGGYPSYTLYADFNAFARPMALANRPYQYKGVENVRFSQPAFTNVNGQYSDG